MKIQQKIFLATDNIADFSRLGIKFTAESTNTPSGRFGKNFRFYDLSNFSFISALLAFLFPLLLTKEKLLVNYELIAQR